MCCVCLCVLQCLAESQHDQQTAVGTKEGEAKKRAEAGGQGRREEEMEGRRGAVARACSLCSKGKIENRVNVSNGLA